MKSQIKDKKISELLREKDIEIKQLREEIEENTKAYEELQETYKIDIEIAAEELSETKQETDEVKKELDKTRKELEIAKSEAAGDVSDLIEQLTMDKEVFEGNCETLQKENDELREELEEVKEELELRRLEEEELKEGDVGEGDSSSAQLQLTLKKVCADFERQKIEYEDKIADLAHSSHGLPELQVREKELSTTLAKRDQEILGLQDALDEALENTDMLEQLTEINMKQGEEIDSMKEQIREFEEIREIENQIAEDQAELEKELNDEIANKEFEIQELNQTISSKEEEIADSNKNINNFRKKTNALQKEIDILKDQMANTGEEDQARRLQQVVDKNLSLVAKVREMKAFAVNSRLSEANSNSLKFKCETLLAALPEKFLDDLDINSIEKVCQLELIKHKTYTLIQEVYTRCLGLEQESTFLKWAFQLSGYLIEILWQVCNIEHVYVRMSLDEYQTLAKSNHWNSMVTLNGELDQFIRMVKDDSLGPSVPLNSLGIVKDSLDEFIEPFKTEGLDKTGDDVVIISIRIALMRSIQYATLGLVTLQNLFEDIKPEMCKDLIAKAYAISAKLLINCDEGNFHEMSMHVKMLQFKMTDLLGIFSGNNDIEGYNWSEWVESIQQDLLAIHGFEFFKAEDTQTVVGQWTLLTGNVKGQLETFASLQDQLNEAKTEIQEKAVKIAMGEKELKEIQTTKQSLEKRLSEAYAKSQKLAQVEADKKRLQDRQKHFDDTIQSLTDEVNKLDKKNKDLNGEMVRMREEEAERGVSLQPEGEMLASNTGGFVAIRRGSSMVADKRPQGHDDTTAYQQIIDNLQSEKSHDLSRSLRAKLNLLDDLTVNNVNPHRETLNSISAKINEYKLTSVTTKIIDLNNYEESKAERAASKAKKESLVNQINSLARGVLDTVDTDKYEFTKFLPSCLAKELSISEREEMKLGKLKSGNGQNTVKLSLGRNDVEKLYKTLNLR